MNGVTASITIDAWKRRPTKEPHASLAKIAGSSGVKNDTASPYLHRRP